MIFHRIETLQLAARIARSELPGNTAPMLVTLRFHRHDLTAQCRLIFQASGERIALQNSDLNLGRNSSGEHRMEWGL